MSNKKFWEMNPNILKLISTKEVTFLKEVNKTIIIDKNGEFKYFKFDSTWLTDIKDFISSLEDNKIYIIIPFVSMSCKIDDPYLILSRQILITKYSDPIIIHDYLYDKLDTAIDQFNIVDLNKLDFNMFLKYKSVIFDFETHRKFNFKK
jgi:hypothetical protein